jgi:para-nitrobenzyl esterase
VLFWVHGGANVYGSAGLPGYDATGFLKHNDAVVVTVNYRLGPLGFLYLGHLDSRFLAGNVALLDLVAALRWTRANIAAFGGDPGNITIFGQSSGGVNISCLLSMQEAAEVFDKAIIESGARLTVGTRDEAIETTNRVLAKLAISSNPVFRLQEIDPRKLIDAYMIVRVGNGTLCLDTVTLGREPCAPDFPAISSHVPLLITTTEDEMAYFLAVEPGFDAGKSDEELLNSLIRYVERPKMASESRGLWRPDKGLLERAVRICRSLAPSMSRWDVAARVLTDAMQWRNALIMANRRLQRKGAPLYLAEFRWKVPSFGGAYAFHGVDIPLVWNYPNIPLAPDHGDTAVAWSHLDPSNRRQSLAVTTGKLFTAFAQAGNPSVDSLPPWPPYEASHRATMAIEYQPVVVNDPRRELRELFQEA